MLPGALPLRLRPPQPLTTSSPRLRIDEVTVLAMTLVPAREDSSIVSRPEQSP